MKKKLVIITSLLLLAFSVVTLFLIDGRRRQADINMIAGVANSFFERDYAQLQIAQKEAVVPFPVEKCSDLFVQKIIRANFPDPILMLNLTYSSYIKVARENANGPIGVPLVWARRTGFGRSYYVYWGVDKKGIATDFDLTKFIESQSKSVSESPAQPDVH